MIPKSDLPFPRTRSDAAGVLAAVRALSATATGKVIVSDRQVLFVAPGVAMAQLVHTEHGRVQWYLTIDMDWPSVQGWETSLDGSTPEPVMHADFNRDTFKLYREPRCVAPAGWLIDAP